MVAPIGSPVRPGYAERGVGKVYGIIVDRGGIEGDDSCNGMQDYT